VNPVYPPAARQAQIQGDVQFRATIDAHGHVKSLDLLRGHPDLVNAARAAVNQWEYEPLVVDGQEKEFLTTVLVHFVLKPKS